MRFRVIGTNQTNRKPIDTVIEAPSLERANMLAGMKKIDVSSIEPVNETSTRSSGSDDVRPARRKSKMPLVIFLVLILAALAVAAYFAGLLKQ